MVLFSSWCSLGDAVFFILEMLVNPKKPRNLVFVLVDPMALVLVCPSSLDGDGPGAVLVIIDPRRFRCLCPLESLDDGPGRV